MNIKHTALLASALAIGLLTATPSQANIVLNPGFESDANWVFSNFYSGAYFAHQGQMAVGTGCVGHACVSTLGQGAFIQQTLATTAGTHYDLSFYVGENSGPQSELSVFWNGVLVTDLLNPANFRRPADVLVSVDDLVATGSSTVLEIHGRQDPGGMYFDDVSVVARAGAATSAVPEPETFALGGIGLLGLLAARRRKAR